MKDFAPISALRTTMKRFAKYLVVLLSFLGFFFLMKSIHDSMCAVSYYIDAALYNEDSKTIDVLLWAWEGEPDGHSGDDRHHVYWNYEISGHGDQSRISISLSQCPCFHFKKALYAAREDKPVPYPGFIKLSIPYEMEATGTVEVVVNDRTKLKVTKEDQTLDARDKPDTAYVIRSEAAVIAKALEILARQSPQYECKVTRIRYCKAGTICPNVYRGKNNDAEVKLPACIGIYLEPVDENIAGGAAEYFFDEQTGELLGYDVWE